MLNLTAGTGHAIEVMDVGFALQAHSLRALARAPDRVPAGPQLVPDDVNDRIARDILATMPAARWTA